MCGVGHTVAWGGSGGIGAGGAADDGDAGAGSGVGMEVLEEDSAGVSSEGLGAFKVGCGASIISATDRAGFEYIQEIEENRVGIKGVDCTW